MKKIILLLLFVATYFLATKAQTQEVLLSGLGTTDALWVKGDNVFFTAGTYDTSSGTNECLYRYRISSGQKSLMVCNLENYNTGVVVASDGKIYLTSNQYSIPGNQGKVSVVDTTTLVETHLLDIEVAALDMCIDDSDNITIIGYNTGTTAKSIYRLPVTNYLNPSVLKTGLGNVWCIAEKDDTTYYSNLFRTYRFRNNGGISTFINKAMMSISLSADYLFYIDQADGRIRRVNLHTMLDQTLVTGVSNSKLRYDAASDALYFLAGGGDVFLNRGGTLNVIHNATAPVLISSNTNFICGGDSTQLCAVEGYESYLWSNGDTSRCIDVKLAGNYNVTATDVANHKDTSGYVIINAYPAPAPVSVNVSGNTLTTSNPGIAYQWSFIFDEFGDIQIVDTSNSYIAALDGVYYVAVMDSNGCVAVSGNTLFLDVKDLPKADGVNICPNPTNGKFTIVMNEKQDAKTEVEIYNVMGEKVYETIITEPSSTIILNVPDGIYFVHLITEQGIESRKIVVGR